MNWVYFDIETERLSHEVGGWANIEQLGVAVAVTHSSHDNLFRVYRGNEMQALLEELKAAECVVGFNSRGFDFRVLQPYVDFDLSRLPNIDLLLDVKAVAGFRPSLNNLCAATLGESKSSDGIEAIQWWREGRHEEVIEYCKQDVLLTRRLHEFGAREKHVRCTDRNNRPRSLAVNWSLDGLAAPLQPSLF
ncbi:MAG: box helicase protein [Abditibacteriota bacterium]|nr:box helicase protein [Abditibacteriota bacterium]